MTVRIGVLKETEENEKRVSMIPEVVARANNLGLEVCVETGAGISSYFGDEEYRMSGAKILTDRKELLRTSDIVVTLQRPRDEDIEGMKRGSYLVGLIYPLKFPKIVKQLADQEITSFSLELMPRSTRAQTMDVLSSQASAGGYTAAVLAAANSPRLIPMLTTAAGTIRPARALIIGAGVAGLMAIATLKRLGASVSAFDVRKSAGEDVRSLGAKFLEININAVGEGGYARDLTQEEKNLQEEMLANAISNSDIVITAAGVPGKLAPIVVSRGMVDGMKKGSVLVDLAAESGGNCELTKVGEFVNHKGVTIIGLSNLPAEVPISSSEMYSRNILSFITLLIDDEGNLINEFSDDILESCLVTNRGTVVQGRIGEGGD